MILGAAYMLWLYRRVIFGELNKENLKLIKDLNVREIAFFAPLVLLTLFMGIYPKPILDILHVSVENLVEQSQYFKSNETVLSSSGVVDIFSRVLK